VKRPATCQWNNGLTCSKPPENRVVSYAPDGLSRVEMFLCALHTADRVKREPTVRRVEKLKAYAA
jgi:hypothetical protein